MDRIFGKGFVLIMILAICLTATASDKKVKKLAKLENSIEKLQAKIDGDRAKIADFDSSIEKNIEEITTMVAAIKDSAESGKRSLRLKEDVMKGLGKFINFYKGMKSDFEKEVKRNPSAFSEERVEEIRSAFDGKIEKRVDDVLAITSSLATFHNSAGNDFEDFHNRRIAKKAEKTRVKVIKKLEKGIKAKEAENKKLEKKAKTDADLKKAEANKKTIEKRKDQVTNILNQSPKSTIPVGRTGVKAREKMIKEKAAVLKSNVGEIKKIIKRLFQYNTKMVLLEKQRKTLEK